VTVDEKTHTALRQLEDLLAGEDVAVIISRALELLFERTLARKAGVTERPRRGKPQQERSRHIPAAVRREVWKRDGARCAFSESGRRCAATRFLEFHHLDNWGRGADHDPERMELRCRAHNQYQAALDYGEKLIAARRNGDRARERTALYRNRRPDRHRGSYERVRTGCEDGQTTLEGALGWSRPSVKAGWSPPGGAGWPVRVGRMAV
jgi:hypothetical protein